MPSSDAYPAVAVVGPLTGPRAAWGELLSAGIAASSQAAIRWATFDDRGDIGQARARATEVIAAGGFAAVIGHFNSLGAIEALPLYQDAGLAVVLPLATSPDIAGELAITLSPDDNAQVTAIAAACAAAPDCDRIIVITDGTRYGRELAMRIRGHALLPVFIADDWPAELGGSAVVLAGVHHSVAAIATRRPPGVRPVFVTDDCDVPEFAELAGDSAAGLQVACLAGGPEGRVAAGFDALAAVLGAQPELRGAALVAALVARLQETEPAGTSWLITELSQVPNRI